MHGTVPFQVYASVAAKCRAAAAAYAQSALHGICEQTDLKALIRRSEQTVENKNIAAAAMCQAELRQNDRIFKGVNMFEEYSNLTLLDHPLLKHKVTRLRDRNTGTNEFRAIIGEIAMLMGYEALRDLPVENIDVETPIEKCESPVIAGRKLAVVPVLRAGLGMVNGILSLVPAAKVGHIGLYRDEITHEPHEYYCKLPDHIEERVIVVVDPMLATGGSAVDAVNLIKQRGGKYIKFMSVIAAPEGIRKFCGAHPDVQLYVAQLDRCLNQDAYICPGLGDAGDRIFGTK